MNSWRVEMEDSHFSGCRYQGRWRSWVASHRFSVRPSVGGSRFSCSVALVPDKEGAVVWEYRTGRGSGIGGVWGGSVDQQNAYFGVSDYLTPAPGGLHAVSLATGQRVWYTPTANPRLCGTAE
jgi:hypothetical protein